MNDFKFAPVSMIDHDGDVLFNMQIIRSENELKELANILDPRIDLHVVDCDPAGTTAYPTTDGSVYYSGQTHAKFPVIAVWVVSPAIIAGREFNW